MSFLAFFFSWLSERDAHPEPGRPGQSVITSDPDEGVATRREVPAAGQAGVFALIGSPLHVVHAERALRHLLSVVGRQLGIACEREEVTKRPPPPPTPGSRREHKPQLGRRCEAKVNGALQWAS